MINEWIGFIQGKWQGFYIHRIRGASNKTQLRFISMQLRKITNDIELKEGESRFVYVARELSKSLTDCSRVKE